MTTSAAIARIPLGKSPRPANDQSDRPATPFLKWVGGKGRILRQLEPLLPEGVENMRHVEPFIGGGALFFSRQPERALISDVNQALVHTYCAIRDEVEGVIEALRRLAKKHSEESYYRVRQRYNSKRRVSSVDRAAMFIYLNKTCFNGLHRVNRKGEFNVPAGRYKNPRILDSEGLERASRALQRAKIHCTGFEALLEDARAGDFVYFDPPYEPVSRTANFTGYAAKGFSQDHQQRLREVFDALDRRGCKLMLSNSDVPFIRKLYKKYEISQVLAPRAINSNGQRRGAVPEVVVRNY